MTQKLSFCLRAAALHDQDSNALTDSIEHYLRAGVTTAQAEEMAVSDLIAAIEAERKEMVGLLREQHPDAFQRTEQTAAQKSAAAKARMAFNPETDSVLQAIAKMGGLRRNIAASEFGLKPEELKHTVATGGLKGYPFRANGGMDLDRVLTNLQEAGYFPGVADEDARGALETAIFDELGGDRTLSVEGQMRDAQDRSAAKLDADEAIEREALLADAELDIGALSDDDIDFFGTSNASTEDAMRALGFSDEEIRDETAREAAPAGTGQDGQDAADQAPAAGRARGEAPGPAAADTGAGFELAGQSADDLKAKAAREESAAAADTAEQKRLIAKARADAARGEFTLTGSDRPADVAAAAGQRDIFGGTVQEPDAPYTTDLFGHELPEHPRKPAAARPAAARVRGDVQPAVVVSDTTPPAGKYFARTIVGTEVQRKLGTGRIASAADAAAATRYLYRSAVERLDGIVTDADGKVLAVIGGFKGAMNQAAVYPSTLMGEAVRIKGAAKVWFSHNHPSGNPSLSRADEVLAENLARIFKGSGIESQGLLAIGNGQFSHVNPYGEVESAQPIPASSEEVSVPAIERTLGAATDPGFPTLDSPMQAKQASRALYEQADRTPGLVLLDTQHRVIGWVPLPEDMRGLLRGTGGLNALYRAVSETNAGAALLVHGGELDRRVPGGSSASMNIAAALAAIDVRPLDSLNMRTGTSAAEEGLPIAGSVALDFEDTELLPRPDVIEGDAAPQDVDAVAQLQKAYRSKVDSLKSLVMTALPRRPAPGKNASDAEKERYAAADLAEKLFGKRVVFFSSNIMFAGGMQADYLPGMIFINEATTRPVQAVIGHELLHSLRGDHPALYAKLGDRLRGILNEPGQYGELLNAKRAQRGLPALPFDKLREELIADIVGDNFTDPAFWRQMSKGQPTLFARVLRVIRDFFDDLLAKLKNERPYGTNYYLTDLQAARDAVVEAMSAFAASPKTAAAAAVAEAEANLSDNNDPFYSELGRQIQTAKMGQGSAQAWKDYLKGLTSKGVKADEIAWTGIEDWLDLQPGKVTREQVLDYLNGNGVKVTETILGNESRALYIERLKAMSREELAAHFEEEQNITAEEEYGENWKPSQLIDDLLENGAMDRIPDDDETKFSSYTLPGGSGYREVLLTLPEKDTITEEKVKSPAGWGNTDGGTEGVVRRGDTGADFRESHWKQPNVVVHVRLNERTDADGKRVLFIEEIQSDWGQKGKKNGFQGDMIPQNRNWQAVDTLDELPTREEAEAKLKELEPFLAQHAQPDVEDRLVIVANADDSHFSVVQESRSTVAEAPSKVGVPRAPFVQKTEAWVGLAIKRMIKLAVDEGFDRVAFVTGTQASDRFDLSKQIDRLTYSEGGVLRAYKDGKVVINRKAEPAELPDLVGKEVAQRLAEAPEVEQTSSGVTFKARELEGLDLQVGGEGMKTFYDRLVPNIAKDVVKKLGGQMTKVVVPLEVQDYERTSSYEGPPRTQGDVERLYNLAKQNSPDVFDNPLTGHREMFAINRVANEQALRKVLLRMREGSPFSSAIIDSDVSEATAGLFGGRIEHHVAEPDKREHAGFDITPAMREKAAGGLPMFSLQYTPEEEAALAKAGINTRTRLQRAGDRIRAYYGSVQSAVRSNFARQFQQGALDQFTGLNLAVRREIGALPVDQDPYVAARLANGATSSVMRGLLLHGQAKWAANGQHLEKIAGTEGLLDILRPLDKSLNDFFGWMIGNRAARLMKEGRENNFTPAQIAALQGLNRGKEAEFRKAALGYAQFKRSVLDVAEEAGLLDPESRKVWDNADYIPFYREIDKTGAFSATGKNSTGPRPMKGLAGQSSGIRTLKGGEAGLNDPMENILMNFSRLIDASLKNRALSKTIDVLEKAGSDIVHKVGYDMNRQVVPASEVRKQLQAAGTPQQILDIIPPEAFEGMAKMWAIQAPTDPDVVRVMRNGKPAFYKVNDPLLLKSLTSFIPFDFPGLGVARAFKRVLTGMVTATPEFMARNFIRDTVASAIITRAGFHPGNSLTGIVKSYRESGAFEDLLFAGASFQSGNINAADPVATGKAMRRALREKGFDASSASAFMASIVDTPAKFWEAYRHVGESIENANREAVYEATLKAGGTPTAAAYESKDMMDFTLRGSSPVYQVVADTVPFFNALVQGMYRVARADPKRVLALGMLMTVATLANALMNAGNDDYDKLPDWDKESYWHFWIKGEHFRVPKPFELGAVFASVPERIFRYALSNESVNKWVASQIGAKEPLGSDTGKKMMTRIVAIIQDQLRMNPTPQIIKPALGAIYNTDSFRDRPIENQGDEGKLPSQRYSKITSATAVAAIDAIEPVANAINLSPKKLEFLVGGYLGTAGLYALGLSDMAVRKLNNEPPRPATRLDELPLIRAFYRQEPAVSTVYESELYKMRKEINEVYTSVRALRKDDKEERADKLEEKNEKLLEARKVVERGAKRLAKLNKQRDDIYNDRTMTPKEKRAAIDELLIERAEVSKETMKSEAVLNAQ